MLTLGILISILISTFVLIVFLDIMQGNDIFEAWFNLKNILKVARGEDYFLITIFIVLFLRLFWYHLRGKK
ncbi:hypothetical protein A6K24_17905 [Metabacillus litoralis]|uniref:Uncharacterized protein n=1 Tax=Metabacillus litoralis TaxID=152268 RepID=A0A179T3N0_9BACI|nr:hypothetical protein A6K24_17905 [Metabacillus litoralis]